MVDTCEHCVNLARRQWIAQNHLESERIQAAQRVAAIDAKPKNTATGGSGFKALFRPKKGSDISRVDTNISGSSAAGAAPSDSSVRYPSSVRDSDSVRETDSVRTSRTQAHASHHRTRPTNTRLGEAFAREQSPGGESRRTHGTHRTNHSSHSNYPSRHNRH